MVPDWGADGSREKARRPKSVLSCERAGETG